MISPIPSFLAPDIRVHFNTSSANTNLATSIPQLLLLAQRLGVLIEPARFQGGTLNDMTSQGTYTGTEIIEYTVEVDLAAGTDTIKWSKDGGATYEATGVSITGSAQALDNGVTVTFGATTGHALGDKWIFHANAAGTVAEATPTEAFSVNEVSQQCGKGSMAHVMAVAALQQKQAFRLFYCTLDDNGSNKAAGSITLSGPATSAGNWQLTIGPKVVNLAIADGDTIAEISIGMQNKLVEILDLPITVNENTATPGKLDIIARNAGTVGNQIEIVSVFTDAIGVSAVLVQPTGGSTDPDSDTALTAVFASEQPLDRYVFPWNTAAEITKLVTHLTSKGDSTEQRGSTAYVGVVDSIANIVALIAGANDWRVFFPCSRGTRDIPYELGTRHAAEIAVRAGADSAAGMNKAKMIGANKPTDDSNKFSRAELETLLESGACPLTVEKGTGDVIMVREVSSSLTITGSPTTERREGNTVRIMDDARENIRARLAPFIVGKNTETAQNAVLATVADVMRAMGDLEQVRNVEADILNNTIETAPSEPTRANMVVNITPISLLHAIAIEMVMFR